MGTYYEKKLSSHPYRLNSFKLEGLEKFQVGYRFINVSGLIEDDEDYEKKIRQLSILISGKVKMPVEPVRVKGETRLAVTGLPEKLKALKINDKYCLTPDDAFTSLEDEIYPLELRVSDNRMHTKLARRALDWAIDNALKSAEAGWWKYGRRFISRRPFESKTPEAIQVFPAFYFGFVPGADGNFELSITPSVCYAERRSAYEKYGQNIPASVKGKRFLYRNGLEFYDITAVGIGKAARLEMMEDPSSGEIVSIQQRLQNRWGSSGIPQINELDENALTIAYKTKGQKSRRAHSQLLFELVGVGGSDEGDETPHNEAIMNSDRRGQITERIIGQLSPYLRLFGVKLNPSRQMRKLNGEVQLFEPPKILLGGEEELTTNLPTMGKDRFDALKYLGPADSSDFVDEQLFIFGESMPEEVRLDFKKRFLGIIKEIYGKSPVFHNVRVDDRRANLMRQQFNAIEKAVGNRRGYGLLILPKERKSGQHRKLHDALKRRFWKQIQTQCASVESILSFYKVKTDSYGEQRWVIQDHKKSLYHSYLRYLALGYLEVNRKWLWKLAKGTLRNEVHVGIDVYQDLAIFTFIYGDADLITFHLSPSKRGEKLSAAQVREAMVTNLQDDLAQLGITPSRIVFHRDGRVFRTEVKGIRNGLQDLKDLQLLPEDLQYAIVEIHKTSSTRPRLYKWLNSKFNNPEMGIFAGLSEFEGILATTGAPLLRRGTAQPLSLELFEGNISLIDIAHDIYALSHLSFASPGSAMSLPFTIALADRILRESSPGDKINLWEEDEDEEINESEFITRHSIQTKAGVANV